MLLLWAKGAAERAVKTAAQVLATLITAGQTGILDFDWKTAGSLVGMAFLASIVTSLTNIDFVAGGGTVDPVPAPVPVEDAVEDTEPPLVTGADFDAPPVQN